MLRIHLLFELLPQFAKILLRNEAFEDAVLDRRAEVGENFVYFRSAAVVLYVVGHQNELHSDRNLFFYTVMEGSGNLSLITLITILLGGIVSVLQLLEYLFTKNIPWILRLFRNAFRRLRRFFTRADDKKGRCIVLNFSGHPVLSGQRKDIQNNMGWPSIEVLDVSMGTVSEDENFLKTAIRKVDDIDLLPNEWQTYPLVVIPSGYAPLWSALLAEVHGRLGHFPDVVRLRPSPQGEKEKFEVAEILDLRDIRHRARAKR